jgi:hypothetical protein
MHRNHITNGSGGTDILERIRAICDTSFPELFEKDVHFIDLLVESVNVILISKVPPGF